MLSSVVGVERVPRQAADHLSRSAGAPADHPRAERPANTRPQQHLLQKRGATTTHEPRTVHAVPGTDRGAQATGHTIHRTTELAPLSSALNTRFSLLLLAVKKQPRQPCTSDIHISYWMLEDDDLSFTVRTRFQLRLFLAHYTTLCLITVRFL